MHMIQGAVVHGHARLEMVSAVNKEKCPIHLLLPKAFLNIVKGIYVTLLFLNGKTFTTIHTCHTPTQAFAININIMTKGSTNAVI